MTRPLKGLNKRVASSQTVEAETYLTPAWAVAWLLRYWSPLGDVVCDPCACGYNGWSVGKVVAGDRRKFELYDLNPQHESVRQADFRSLVMPALPFESRTIITNPPYNLLPEFVRWGLTQAEEVVVLTRFGFLCAENGARAKNLYGYYQPAKRLAFELLPKEGERRVQHNARLRALLESGELTEKEYQTRKMDVHVDSRTLTGYRMSSTGVDHGWAVFRRGYEDKKELVIESADVNEEEPDNILEW